MSFYRASFYVACLSLMVTASRLYSIGTIGADLALIIGLIAFLLIQLKATSP